MVTSLTADEAKALLPSSDQVFVFRKQDNVMKTFRKDYIEKVIENAKEITLADEYSKRIGLSFVLDNEIFISSRPVPPLESRTILSPSEGQ